MQLKHIYKYYAKFQQLQETLLETEAKILLFSLRVRDERTDFF